MTGVLQEHLGYLTTPGRLELYRAAVAKLVRPGDFVLDAGCGTGVLGLLCLQAGAEHVYAVDASAALEIAREAFCRSPWANQADFIRGSTFHVDLPRQVDVVICDHVGYFGFDYGLIELLGDARRRFLKLGGKLIPSRLMMCIAATESTKSQQLAEAWNAPEIPAEFHWLRQYGVNSKHAVALDAGELISGPAELACLDLQTDHSEFFSWSTQLLIHRDGVVHGLAGWFDCELAEGIWMTNSPLARDAIKRSQVFLPIDAELPVRQGDLLDVTIMTRPSDHLLAWAVVHRESGRRFRHSTWLGTLLERGQLAQRAAERPLQISRRARARSLILEYCNGQRTAAQIEAAVLRDHPSLFPTKDEIARFITHVLTRDTE